MNYGKQTISLHKRANLHRNILLALLTTILLFLCILIGSNIVSSCRSKAAAQNNSYKYYTSIEIEKGDTLWKIAEEYMSSEYVNVQDYVDEIKEVNHLGDDDIHAGQYLMVPYFSTELK